MTVARKRARHWRLMTPDLTPLRIRPWQPGDDEAIVRCYNAVFPDPARGIAARSLEHWQWQFRSGPVDRMLHMLAVHDDGSVAGIYAGVPMRIWCQGTQRLAAQGVDFCVRPEWRRHGGEPGMFVRLGRRYIDDWHGTGNDQIAFTYGLPVPAWKNGSRHLGWLNIRDFDATFRELGSDAAPRPVPGDLAVGEVPRIGADVDELFARVRPRLGLASVRDRLWFDWRYAARPDGAYRQLECRERQSGRLRGVAVYGVGNLLRRHTSYLVDWLQDEDDHDAMVAMIGACEAFARQDGTGMLCSTWNHVDPRFLAMQELGYRVRGTPWFVVLATPCFDTFFFREQWYFTLGDFDLM
jgi:hypothetical protein